MAALYRQHILGEKPEEKGGFVSLGSIGGIKPAAPVREEVKEEVFGD